MTKQKSSATKSAPHIRVLHKRRAAWFAVLVAGVLAIQIAYNIHHGQAQILGYTTAISNQSLIESTNKERLEKGLGELAGDPTLQKVAQAKADDMAKRNYWSHIDPDGKTAWDALARVHYNYGNAGENLAYGFSTSDEVLSAWLQSEKHSDNVLGDFKHVGFGVVKAKNYQGGDNTIIVAVYATPKSDPTPSKVLGATLTDAPAGVSGFAIVTTGGANWATYASLALVGAAAIGFVVTHLELLRHGWYRSRHYLALHPVTDAVVVTGIAVIVVYAAGGFIL